MRCVRAQRWMTTALDDELTGRRRRALDRHLARCEACHRELALTDRVLTALAAVPTEVPLPAGLEQATLRAVRAANAPRAETVGWGGWLEWLGHPVPALAALSAVLAIAGAAWWRTGGPPVSSSVPPVASRSTDAPSTARSAPPTLVAVATERRLVPEPSEPPPDLAAAPDLFVDLPILLNIEKLRNFDAILTTTVDGGTRAPEESGPPSG